MFYDNEESDKNSFDVCIVPNYFRYLRDVWKIEEVSFDRPAFTYLVGTTAVS